MTLAAQNAGLVRRARCGDQNAMAMITLIRDNAAAGVPLARTSHGLIMAYIRNNPVDGMTVGADFGGDIGADPVQVMGVRLALGPVLSDADVYAFCRDMTPAECNAFVDGMYFRPMQGDPVLANANAIGRAVTNARRLQAVRMGGPIANFDPASAWELGEDV
jgi:hypothetical protein